MEHDGTKRVVNQWWDGPDFLVETDDGAITRYENAHFSSHIVVYPLGSCVEVVDLEVKYDVP